MDFKELVDKALLNKEEEQGERLAYWRQRLEGADVLLHLPLDRSPAPRSSSATARQTIVLPPPLSAALQQLSRQEGVSLFITLLAAFETLLYRYSGQNDMLIGTPIVGSTGVEQTDGMVGFVNFLVLRTDLSNNPSFRELLKRVYQVVLEAEAHEVPFEQVVEALQPEPDPSRHPLFQVMFVLAYASMEVLEVGELTLRFLPENSKVAKCDLILCLQETGQELRGWVEYNRAMLDASSMARLVGHWQTLLEGAVADPDQHLDELPLLTEAERRQLLVEWNATQTAYPKDQTIHQLFEAQVERTPDAVAVVYESQQLTYRELNARANQLAHHLRQLGVGPEVRVGLCLERSLEMVVGLLGILKAGGAYMPLDPAYPSGRLAFMLADSQAPVLVTQQHLAIQLPVHGAKDVCLDSDEVLLGWQSGFDLLPAATSDNLAYLIYTSGSTGRPKGVQILHCAVVNFLLSMRQQPGLTAEDTLLAVTTLSFDIAALEVFLPLLVGARLVVASRDVAANGAALAEALTRWRATVMQATPVTWRMLLAAGWQGSQQLKILCGGEALSRELAQQLLPKAASLWNLYGPTETTIWSTVCKIEPDDEVVSIGRPIANTQIYLLDPHLQPVPVGVPGDLYIGGEGLARGYLNRPELTAERFIPHPFSDGPGARLYNTGDLARYCPDGTIEHLGRLDFQVKLRGFRIELGEIEAVLAQHPAVRQAVVVAREDVPGDKRLVAYVVPRREQTPTSSELRSIVQERLPDYMVPAAIMLLEALPLTPNGKVDRRALPAPEHTRPGSAESFVAPTLPVHQQLVGIWEELLDVRPIGIRDNFFELGGHSLLAVRLVDRIEQVWGKKISSATLLAGATIEQLSDVLMQPADAVSTAAPGAGHANGARRTSPIRSIWSSLIGRRGR